MSSTSRVAAGQTFLVPAIASGWVLVVGGSLLLIIGRSPYTHGNLFARPNVSYTRTGQIMVGAPVPFTGMHGRAAQPDQPVQSVPPASSAATPVTSSSTSMTLGAQSLVADSLTRGQELMVTAGCATCHGLTGRMPAYAPGALSDDDLSAIAAYLASQAKPTTGPTGPTGTTGTSGK